MLFHRALARDSGVEIFHMLASLPEVVDADAFYRAWQRVVDRYAIYRTGFRWQGIDEPVQEVHRSATLDWHEEDWSGGSPAEQEERLEAFLQADRARGVDLERPPLIRVALFRLAEADWRFVWTMYHGVVDGRSALAVLIEVFAAYESFRRGEAPEAPTAEPFRRYIEWLAAQDMAAAEVYWKGLLEGFRAPTPLSTAKVARRLLASREAHSDREIQLSEETWGDLARLCERLGVTFHTLLQASWGLLLSRYSHTGDVVFGCVKSNRAAVPGGHRIIGPLINTLIMRVTTSPDLRLAALLEQVRAQWVAHREHEFVPLSRVERWSQIPAETRLFESIVVSENHRWIDVLRARGGAWADRDLWIRRQPEYPLTLYGFKAKQPVLKLIYDRRAFDTTMIVRMLGHLDAILQTMACDSDRRLDEIVLLTPAERSQVLLEWNDTRTAIDVPPVHRAFEARAQERPAAEAVADSEQRLTYEELNHRANSLARFLMDAGVEPEVPVALCLRRSVELVKASLAVLKAGGSYVPLDPSQPARRLELVLEELGWPLLLTHEDLRPGLTGLGSRVVAIDGEPAGWTLQKVPNPDRPVLPQQLAYLIYTSGSTGRPKGVAVTHHNLSNLVSWRKTLAVSPGDRGALVVNPSFDPWMWELWPYLTAGASVHVAPEEARLAPVQLRDWLLQHEITGCVLPTPVAELVLTLEWPEVTPLRRLLIGGDRLNARPAPGMDFLVFNNYGPAECTVAATSDRVEPASADSRPPSIGRPIDNIAVYLVDRQGLPVPAGVVGEILLGGEGVARGYWCRPQETAERFIPDPFSGEPGARLYRTGDLARFDPAGALAFCGRTDDQVKVRGMRVEMGEVEVNLRAHPGIREAVVLALRPQPEDLRLAAFFVPAAPEQAPDAYDLQQHLRRRLPAHMVPSAFVSLERLPLTSNGKLDRRALPVPAELGAADPAHLPPQTAEERTIADVWRQVLQIDRVGLDDNFYEVGGHSLALIRIQEKLQSTLAPEVRLVDLMENPTVRLQAQRLSSRPAEEPLDGRV